MRESKLLAKVCGLAQAENIAEIADIHPDFMGFIFYRKSPRYALLNELRDVVIQLPESIKKVGVFVNEDLEIIQKIAKHYKLVAIQLHGDEPPMLCKLLQDSGYIVIKAFGIRKMSDFSKFKHYEEVCDYFLFDSKTKLYGGSGKQFNWSHLKRYTFKTPFFLSGGISPENYKEALSIQHPQFAGIDVNSKFELSPGIKDVQKVQQLVKDLSQQN